MTPSQKYKKYTQYLLLKINNIEDTVIVNTANKSMRAILDQDTKPKEYLLYKN